MSLGDGSTTIDVEQIRREVLQHFKGQFTSNMQFDQCNQKTIRLAITSHLTYEQCFQLAQPIIEEEIKTTLFSLGHNKALGLNRYPVEFIVQSWEVIENEVTNAILEFFKTSKPLKEVGNTILALVPKIVNPTSLSDFRPISCCNTIYKCVVKVMANLIAPLLPSFIGNE